MNFPLHHSPLPLQYCESCKANVLSCQLELLRQNYFPYRISSVVWRSEKSLRFRRWWHFDSPPDVRLPWESSDSVSTVLRSPWQLRWTMTTRWNRWTLWCCQCRFDCCRESMECVAKANIDFCSTFCCYSSLLSRMAMINLRKEKSNQTKHEIWRILDFKISFITNNK